jgi:hypothetical protein
MCALPQHLEIYTADATFMVKTPDCVDPARTNPDALWVNAKIDDVGSSSPAVARTFIMASQVLKTGQFDSSLDAQATLMQMHQIKATLVQCEKSAKQFQEAVKTEQRTLTETGFRLESGGRALEKFPVISDIDARVTHLLIHAKRAIQEVCDLIGLFWKLKKRHTRLDQLIRKLKATLGDQHPLTAYLTNLLPAATRIVDLRNFQEHGAPKRRLTVENFSSQPDGHIRLPVWYLTGETPKDIVFEMNAITDRLIDLAEGTFVGCVSEKLSQTFPWCFECVDNPPAAVPVRFRLTADLSRLIPGQAPS